MQFVDLGCSLNYMLSGYDQWPSTYHGVDISRKTIQLLREYAKKKKLSVGSLFCGSMHSTPYEANAFDIGACIGSLEYFREDFVEKAMTEARRILKPDGRFVLDIPDVGSPEFGIAKMIEAYLGRMDQFDMPIDAFEKLLAKCFVTDKKEKVGAMIQYFVRCRK